MNIKIIVTRAIGDKCERCRLIKEDVGSIEDYPDLCIRCAKVIRELDNNIRAKI